MKRSTMILLAGVGMVAGGLTAYLVVPHPTPRSASPVRRATAPAAPPTSPTPHPVLETPAERMRPDLYQDTRYGFSIKPAPGWHNLVTGDLRRDFPEARGALVENGAKSRRYLQIQVQPVLPGQPKADAGKFRKSMVQALRSAGVNIINSDSGQLAGTPMASVTVSAKVTTGVCILRHVWIFGPKANIHLLLGDNSGDYHQALPAFSRMLHSFKWTQ